MFAKCLACSFQSFCPRVCLLIVSLTLVSLLLGAPPAHAAQLALTWSDLSSNEDGFHVERKTGTGGTYATIATPSAGTTGYVDGTVTAGATYCYRLHAYNTAGDSAYSNEACAAAAPVTYTVTVSKSGTGSGTVASSPTGVDCGTDCREAYAAGTSVALSATPAAGATFTGWSGACTGTGPCPLVVDAAKSVTATFTLSPPATYALSVVRGGTGSGTVTSTPTGITCGSDCSESYAYNTSVTLTAAASTGATFSGWSGACTGAASTCVVSMTAARSVTATFTASTYTLTVAPTGTGSGTVTSNPTGVSCGADCSEPFSYNTSVTLTAAAATGSTFTGWSGACTGTASICTVSMTAARSVTATFALSAPVTYTLMVAKSGTGAGIVASNPGGIDCGATCSASFSTGTTVTLEALPQAGSTFTGWSGACTGLSACTVMMSQVRNVTGTFAMQTTTLAVAQSGPVNGTVISSPNGIACQSSCSAAFPLGTTVDLVATPPPRASFTGWSGACSGSGVCRVLMNQSKSVTAKFNRKHK